MEYVGIDIAKAKFDLAWLSSKTGKVRNKVFENKPSGFADMVNWLSKQGLTSTDCHVAMEATGQYYEAVATFLADAGYTVSVVNPLQIKAFSESMLRRQKTDKADADLIARYCAQNELRPWTPPPPETRELQRLLARLEALQDMLVQEKNREYESQGTTLESVERVIHTLEDEKSRLEKKINDHIDHHPGLRERKELLCSIPGIAARVSSYFLAWMNPDRFDDVRQAVAFIGLSPQHHESGDSVRGKSRLCKIGHGRLRKVLYMPAMSAIQCNPAAKAMAERLKAGGKSGKVVIVAVMRKLVHWMMGVVKSGVRFDPDLALARS